MPRVRVTRRLHFSAAHRLGRDDWDDARNREVFGLCSNPNWHGHNYTLEVTVAGEPDAETGYVIDLARLKAVLEERILRHVDHRNLNLDVPWFAERLPSAENIAVFIWEQLAPRIPAGQLKLIRLWETPRNYVEYEGDAR